MYDITRIACAKNVYLRMWIFLKRPNNLNPLFTTAIAKQRLKEMRELLVRLCGEDIMSEFVTWQPRNRKGQFTPVRARWLMQ